MEFLTMMKNSFFKKRVTKKFMISVHDYCTAGSISLYYVI